MFMIYVGLRTRSLRVLTVLLGGLGLLSVSANSNAASYDPNQAPNAVGVQGDVTVYFTFPSSGSCYIWYMQEGPMGVKGVSRGLSLVTAAYLSGKKIRRIDYTQSGNSCFATLVQF
jgi:hypothetical protein